MQMIRRYWRLVGVAIAVAALVTVRWMAPAAVPVPPAHAAPPQQSALTWTPEPTTVTVDWRGDRPRSART